ncbi:MAG: hypothetical protein ACRENQ_11155 [Gemmatimonadaceae bacterium]
MPSARRVLPPNAHRYALLAVAAGMILAPHTTRAQTDTTAKTVADTTIRTFRIRILGVFDEETGEPIEGADVSDLVSGLTVRTTKTGTVPLYLTDTTSTLLRIKKLGYQQSLLTVATSLRDTAPVTTTLMRMGHWLSPVIVTATGAMKLPKDDTIPELIRNGFYEREETSAAPRSAFVTGDKLRGVMLVSDARFYGRGICESNVYVDGTPFPVPPRTGRVLDEGIDQLISPYDVAGIETYEFGESPVGSAHTTSGSATLDPANGDISAAAGNGTTTAAGTLAGNGCVTLIWLRH